MILNYLKFLNYLNNLISFLFKNNKYIDDIFILILYKINNIYIINQYQNQYNNYKKIRKAY
jgi:hypothetical protein